MLRKVFAKIFTELAFKQIFLLCIRKKFSMSIPFCSRQFMMFFVFRSLVLHFFRFIFTFISDNWNKLLQRSRIHKSLVKIYIKLMQWQLGIQDTLLTVRIRQDKKEKKYMKVVSLYTKTFENPWSRRTKTMYSAYIVLPLVGTVFVQVLFNYSN